MRGFTWAGGTGTPLPLGPNNLRKYDDEMKLCENIYQNSPKSVTNKHWSGSKNAKGGVILLGHKLKIIGVLSLPLRASVLEPNFNLNREFFLIS